MTSSPSPSENTNRPFTTDSLTVGSLNYYRSPHCNTLEFKILFDVVEIFRYFPCSIGVSIVLLCTLQVNVNHGVYFCEILVPYLPGCKAVVISQLWLLGLNMAPQKYVAATYWRTGFAEHSGIQYIRSWVRNIGQVICKPKVMKMKVQDGTFPGSPCWGEELGNN